MKEITETQKSARYALFAGETYYPGGGYHDFVGAFDTLEEAIDKGKSDSYADWWHIVDKQTDAKIAYLQRGVGVVVLIGDRWHQYKPERL